MKSATAPLIAGCDQPTTAADAAGAMYFAGDVSPSDATAGGATKLQPLSSDCGLSGQFVFTCTHGYIAKVAPGGDSILWSSTFGGDGVDSITKLSVASDGAVVFAGSTTSKSLPLTGYPRMPGSVFVATLRTPGPTLLAAVRPDPRPRSGKRAIASRST